MIQHYRDGSGFPFMRSVERRTLPLRPMLVQPASNPFQFNCGGKRFIEGTIILYIDQLVSKLVKYQLSKLRVGVTQEGIEHGVLEPPQGRVGANPANAYVVSFHPELVGKTLGFSLRKKTTVTDTA